MVFSVEGGDFVVAGRGDMVLAAARHDAVYETGEFEGAACVVAGIQLDFHLFQGREEKILFTEIHRWTGYLFGAGVLLHLAWHAKWVAVASKQWIKK